MWAWRGVWAWRAGMARWWAWRVGVWAWCGVAWRGVAAGGQRSGVRFHLPSVEEGSLSFLHCVSQVSWPVYFQAILPSLPATLLEEGQDCKYVIIICGFSQGTCFGSFGSHSELTIQPMPQAHVKIYPNSKHKQAEVSESPYHQGKGD